VPSASNDERELTNTQQDYFFYQKQSQSYQLHLNVILKFIITNINLPYLQRFKMYFAGAVYIDRTIGLKQDRTFISLQFEATAWHGTSISTH
jgi:hypothetical protein